MPLPGNGIFVVQGEMSMLVTAMRGSTRWGSHSFPNEEYDVLIRTFQDLKTILNQVDDLRLLDPLTYLGPFLEVIRSKETTGPVTSLALSAIHKFLSYGLIDPTHPSVPATVEDIADAVTHARFVGTDHSSDGVVLLKILQVLRTLMLSPEGVMLTDESVCDIMLSCFRTCFETRLTELLRRNAEQCLRDMTQLIFMRLPQFPEDGTAFTDLGLTLKRRERTKKKLTTANSTNSLETKPSITEQTSPDNEVDENKQGVQTHNQDKNLMNEAEITIEPLDQVKSPKKHARHSSMDLANSTSITHLLEKCVSKEESQEKDQEEKVENAEEPVQATTPTDEIQNDFQKLEEYVNHRGIRFTQQEESLNLQPYGLVCVKELFRFLISLINPLDAQNTSAMVQLGLSLVNTALEVSAEQLAASPALLGLVRDPLCRNLISLLDTERISIFALDLQLWFLLFEALRSHLKYQMEAFFKKIIEIISADTTKSIYELKEIHHIALESLAQMFRIPGLCTELYLNFDCDIYCTNIFEELAKLLSKNVVSSTAYNIHTMSLEALMTMIEAIEMGTAPREEVDVGEELVEQERQDRGRHVTLELGGMDDASVVSDHVTHDISQYFITDESHKTPIDLPTDEELDHIKNMKKWVTQGTELFNQKPERGIEFLLEHGVLSTPLDPKKVALFLRENPDLDKKMIGEYICKRSSRDEDNGPSILTAFAESFDYSGLRVDQALRLYLETFRLPGEAPLISLVMEKFAERWHSTNGEPFANTDAAFRLAYAVIMLNVDQHNHNAKKLNVPMTVEDFIRNLRGCNGSDDFDQAMLETIFHAIKNEEMVMPAERVGPLRDAYLWRVLQRRTGATLRPAPPAPHRLHARLLPLAAPPAVTALSASFERAPPPSPEEAEAEDPRDCAALVALSGLERCAALVARLSADTITLDTILLTLCKFTGLLTPQHSSYIAIGVSLGQSSKAMWSLRRACTVAARHADCARDGWRHLLEILTTLYVARLLPKCMVEAEDYLAPGGTVSLIREASRGTESGILSSLYSYIALGESGVRGPTPHERVLIAAAADAVARCNLPALLVTETRFLEMDSLQELVKAMIAVGTPPDSDSLQLNPQLEDITIFFLELLGQTLIQNRDRVVHVWAIVSPHMERVVRWAGRSSGTLTRALTAQLRTAARLMRCDQCAPLLLQHLTLLYRLPYRLFYQQADVISCGLYELVKTSAQNIHNGSEWSILLSLLAAAGAGAWPRVHTHTDNIRNVNLASGSNLFVGTTATAAGFGLTRTGGSVSQTMNFVNLQVITNAVCSRTYPGTILASTLCVATPSGRSTCSGDSGGPLVAGGQLGGLVITLTDGRQSVCGSSLISNTRLVTAAHCWRTPGFQARQFTVVLGSIRLFSGGTRINTSNVRMHGSYNQQTLHNDIAVIIINSVSYNRSSRSEASEDESERQPTSISSDSELSHSPQTQGWIVVKNEPTSIIDTLELEIEQVTLRPHRSSALARCVEALALVIRDVAHVTPHNCRAAVRCVRLLARATLHSGKTQEERSNSGSRRRARSDSSDDDDTMDHYHMVSIQLLDLMHTLHSRTAQIFKWWKDEADMGQGAEDYDLWEVAWKPLLQGIAEFCTDRRKQVANSAIAYLQRALLAPALAALGGAGWEACFDHVLLPLLHDPPRRPDAAARADTVMCKVFLQHLSALSGRSSFPALWSRVARVQRALLASSAEPLREAALESLKNMLLVMHSVRIFNDGDGYNDLWHLTWEIIGEFLPTLKDELFPHADDAKPPQSLPGQAQSPLPLPPNIGPVGANSTPILPTPTNIGTNIPQNMTITPNINAQTNPQLVQPSQTQSIPIQIQRSAQSPNILVGTVAHSPVAVGVSAVGPKVGLSANVGPKVGVSPTLAAPVSGMVPIRNSLYDQTGLTSSVLLQPLNEMISTPIGISIQTQPPILLPRPEPVSSETSPNHQAIESTQGELYNEYITNPYNVVKELSEKEATLYDPDENRHVPVSEPLIQKSYSANATPMHAKNKTQFGSTDNLRQESSIFNFSNYFGTVSEKNSEVFDTLMSTQEG